MPAANTLLELEKVTKSYSSPDGSSSVLVLNNVCLSVGRGESLAIVGPSGSGKSTLLHIMGTLDRPTSGRVMLGGTDLGQLNDMQLASVRNQQIGFVFQSHFLLPQCTVWENVLVPTLANPGKSASLLVTKGNTNLSGQQTHGETAEARALRLLKRVGLEGRINYRPGQLSGGERQRVAVVRALINKPELLLADEPTGSLDHASAQTLGQLLVDLNREEGVTLIVVTHAPDLAKRMARVLRLVNGALVEAK